MLNLNPPQKYVMDSEILWSGFNCVLQMPTGTGKTWLAEQAIRKTIADGKRAIYLTPLRALAEELFARWKVEFKGIAVGIFTGDYTLNSRKPPVSFEEALVLIMTPERLDACTRNWRSHWKWIPETDVLIADEFHLLNDLNRGPKLEGALLRLMRLNPFLRILALSATMGNRTELADWLEGVEFVSDWRAIPLTWRVLRFRKADDKPGLLLREVTGCVAGGGKSLVFVQSRRRAEQIARLLSDQNIKSTHHHAGLQNESRKAVEQGFRNGEFDAIVSTGTLEMGLNLPVRQVILYDLQEFNGSDFQPISVIRAWQRAGRAGRLGLDDRGEVVLLAPSWERDLDRYLKGNFEPILSRLDSQRAMAEQIVAEVASGLCRTAGQLEHSYSVSLASKQKRLPKLSVVINKMLLSGMLKYGDDEEENSSNRKIKATRLGRIASRHQLAPDTILFLKRVFDREERKDLSFLDILLIAIGSGDCEPLLPVDFEELDSLSSILNSEKSVILSLPRSEIVRILESTGKRLLSIIKTALVVRTWTRLGDAEEVASKFDCYPFEIFRLQESLSRLLTAAVALLSDPSKQTEGIESDNSLSNEEPSLVDRCKALFQMVMNGVDEETVSLTLISKIGGILARRLLEAGISDIEELALAEPDFVASVRGVSQKRATEWITQAEDLIKNKSAFHFRETVPKLKHLSAEYPKGFDPYRLRRAMDLKVIRKSENSYVVSGGLEPHRTNSESCDCLDFSRGKLCKHIFAVRLHCNDPQTCRLVKALSIDTKRYLDLFDLWFDR